MGAERHKGDQSTLRASNRRRVLNYVRRLGPVSRSQLAKLTGLSAAAISQITAALIEEGLLVERSFGEAGAAGGRRPILLATNYAAYYSVGIKLREDRLEAVLTDLSTRVLAHMTASLEDRSPENVAAQVASACRRLFEDRNVRQENVVGVGIGLSGVIDADRGIAVHVPLLGWRNVPISQYVAEQTGLPAFVDNDVNAFAAAERLFGHGKNARNFLVVAVGRGVGGALVVNGEIYRGRNGGAGEFGHNIVVPNGRRCSCGRLGCLEAYTSEPALVSQFVERHPEHAGITIDELVHLANTGHRTARSILSDAGRLLGTHLSYLVNAFNPELIIFGGEAARLGTVYFDPLRETMRALVFDYAGHDLPFIVIPWYDDDFTPWARGAASLAAQYAFDTGSLHHLKGELKR
ncbi:MAG: ROK family transcriptional regulator [Firmicutes bacterium]|nr:ROK family transcriptional regulator [Bacillota bacterium]